MGAAPVRSGADTERLDALLIGTPSGATSLKFTESVPTVPGVGVAVTVYTTRPPDGRLSVSAGVPAPAGLLPVAPPPRVLVNVTFDSPEGRTPAIEIPSAPEGPELLTITVNVVGWPTTPTIALGETSIEMFAWGVTVTVAVAALLAGLPSVTPAGAATDAVSVTGPATAGLSRAVTV